MRVVPLKRWGRENGGEKRPVAAVVSVVFRYFLIFFDVLFLCGCFDLLFVLFGFACVLCVCYQFVIPFVGSLLYRSPAVFVDVLT